MALTASPSAPTLDTDIYERRESQVRSYAR